MIKRAEIEEGEYLVVIENSTDEMKTEVGVDNWQLIFTSKQGAANHISALNKALEFWEYD